MQLALAPGGDGLLVAIFDQRVPDVDATEPGGGNFDVVAARRMNGRLGTETTIARNLTEVEGPLGTATGLVAYRDSRRVFASAAEPSGGFGAPRSVGSARGATASIDGLDVVDLQGGRSAVAWGESGRRQGRPEARVRIRIRGRAGGFGRVRTVARLNRLVSDVRLFLGARREIVAVWTACATTDGPCRISSARSSAGGRFRPATSVSRTARRIQGLTVGSNGRGDAVAVWNEVREGVERVVVAEATSRRFASPQSLRARRAPIDALDRVRHAVAVNDRGEAVVVWKTAAAGSQPIRAALARRGRRFERARRIGRGLDPAVAFDGRDAIVAAWRRSVRSGQIQTTFRRY